MFTGLIQTVGTWKSAEARGSGVEVAIEAPDYGGKLVHGESIAVNGCCLTVETFDQTGFTVFASPETLAKTSLGDRKPGDGVNLERALAMGDKLGGHLVSGHVDTTGRFREARETGDAWEVWIEAPEDVLRQSIPKGSIAVDGISLTMVDLERDAFSLWIIPETWRRTVMSTLQPGQRVNLETDMIGKYVFRVLEQAGADQDNTGLAELWKPFNASE